MVIGINAVIFDCDGTLVDSEVPGLDVLHELTCSHGLRLSREQAHERFRGLRMANCISWIGSQLDNKPPGFEIDFMNEVRIATDARFRQGLRALPGAHELLQRIQMPFCVATNGPRNKVELTLGMTGLLPVFGERIFCAYEIGSFKPDPGLFLHAAGALGVAPSLCAVVEDSLPGVQAGLEAGMQVFTLHPRIGVPSEIADQITFIENLGVFDQHIHRHLQK